MNPFFKLSETNQKDDACRQKVVNVQKTPNKSIESMAVPDNAIWMKEQSLMHTEVSIAPGSPENLW